MPFRVYFELLLASLFVAVAWGIWIYTPIIQMPALVGEVFIFALVTIFLFQRIKTEKDRLSLLNYIYGDGVKTLTISVALASIAVTFTFALLNPNIPQTLTLPLSSIVISKQEMARDLIQTSTNLISLFIPLTFVYLAGFSNYLKLDKGKTTLIQFIALWFFIIAVFMFLLNIIMILGTIRFFLYAYFAS